MSSREPSFCPTHFSSCRRHSVTLRDLFTYLSLSTFFYYQLFIDSYYQHLLLYVLSLKSFCILPHTGYLHSFSFVDLRNSTVCSDKIIQVFLMDETLLSVSFYHCSGSLASCLTSLLPCSTSLQHLIAPFRQQGFQQEVTQVLVPAVTQLPEQDRRTGQKLISTKSGKNTTWE